jgi:DNA polymerase elongation subunit (family B)
VLKHYFGITYEDRLVVRGIEIRRHDTPDFIKQFQAQLLYTLFDCKDSDEVPKKGYQDALASHTSNRQDYDWRYSATRPCDI